MNNTLKYVLAAIVAAAAVTIILYSNTGTTQPEMSPSPSVSVSGSPRACTMEAKLCPDGTAVGRVGPDCEFAPCPTPRATMAPSPTSAPQY